MSAVQNHLLTIKKVSLISFLTKMKLFVGLATLLFLAVLEVIFIG
jgi:hypothetical protein